MNDLKSFKDEFYLCVKPLEKKFNGKFKIDRITNMEDYIISNFTFIKNEFNGKSIEEIEFQNKCEFYGYLSTDYKKIFKFQNQEYMLVGFNIKAHKYPLKCIKIKDQRKFSFTIDLKSLKY